MGVHCIQEPYWFQRLRTQLSLCNASPRTIDTECSPSCLTTLRVLRHKDDRQINGSTQRARKIWIDLVPDAKLSPHSAGPSANFFSLIWPLGKTERVRLAADILETLWLYDDVAEDLPHGKALALNTRLGDSLGADTAEKRGEQALLVDLLQHFRRRLIEVDQEGALRVIGALKCFLKNYDSQRSSVPRIEEYTEFRIVNSGFWLMECLMQWTMGMRLTDTEQQACYKFGLSAGRALGLTNDLYSWNMERNEAADRQWNAVPVIMAQYGIDEVDAIMMLKGLIVHHEQEMRQLGFVIKKLESCNRLTKYVDAVGLLVGGNCFWSSSCPRYNAGGQRIS